MEYDYPQQQRSWKWESVWSSKINSDNGPYITYFVLFVPWTEIECSDSVWESIVILTAANKLGYRAARSPEVMTGGEHAGFYTLILDVPEYLPHKVERTLRKYGLMSYVQKLKQRRRFHDSEYPEKLVLKSYKNY